MCYECEIFEKSIALEINLRNGVYFFVCVWYSISVVVSCIPPLFRYSSSSVMASFWLCYNIYRPCGSSLGGGYFGRFLQNGSRKLQR